MKSSTKTAGGNQLQPGTTCATPDEQLIEAAGEEQATNSLRSVRKQENKSTHTVSQHEHQSAGEPCCQAAQEKRLHAGKHVTFAPGPLNTADGHPGHEGQLATPLPVPLSNSLTIRKPITKKDVKLLEDILGEENLPSLKRLKRRAEYMSQLVSGKSPVGKRIKGGELHPSTSTSILLEPIQGLEEEHS